MIVIDSIFLALFFGIVGSLCLWLAVGKPTRIRLLDALSARLSRSKPVSSTVAPPTITKRSLRRQQMMEWDAQYAVLLREHTDYFVGEIKTPSELVKMLELNRRSSAYNDAVARAEKRVIDRFTGQDQDQVRSIQPINTARRRP